VSQNYHFCGLPKPYWCSYRVPDSVVEPVSPANNSTHVQNNIRSDGYRQARILLPGKALSAGKANKKTRCFAHEGKKGTKVLGGMARGILLHECPAHETRARYPCHTKLLHYEDMESTKGNGLSWKTLGILCV